MAEHNQPSERLGRLLGRIRLTLVVALVFFVAGELAIRVYEGFLVDGEVGSLAHFVEEHDDHWRIRPNARVIQTDRLGGTSYTFNSLGFRDREHADDGAGRRVLFLGDSVTFGLEVEDDEPFPRLIEDALDADGGDDPGHVMNLALFAYAPVDSHAVLRHFGLGFAPELVVLQLYLNDFEETAGRVRPPPGLRRRLRAGWNRVVNTSAFYRRMRQLAQVVSYRILHEVRRVHFPYTLNDDEPRALLALFERHPEDEENAGLRELAAIRDTVAGAGAELLVILTPNEVQLWNDAFDSINERVARRCENIGIAFADPLDMLRAAEHREQLYTDGLHFSPLGHRLMAEWMLPMIREKLASQGREPVAALPAAG